MWLVFTGTGSNTSGVGDNLSGGGFVAHLAPGRVGSGRVVDEGPMTICERGSTSNCEDRDGFGLFYTGIRETFPASG